MRQQKYFKGLKDWQLLSSVAQLHDFYTSVKYVNSTKAFLDNNSEKMVTIHSTSGNNWHHKKNQLWCGKGFCNKQAFNY